MTPADPSENPAAPAPSLETWILALRDLAAELAASAPEMRDQLARVFVRLRVEQVRVTFGGHFKTGKSTVINGALGRSILPVDDLPETGAICVLRSASIDFAQVRSKTEVWPIPFTTEAIQEVVSLLSERGERRARIREIEQVELTLAGSPIPPRAAWVDTPGINDTPEMDERAHRAVVEGDLLIWVLGSRQLLSEAEMMFLAPLVAERGPGFVLFLVNAFLREDTEEEWAGFLQRQLPRHQGKIADAAADLGYPEGSAPRVLIVAGRALGRGGDGFGGAELRAALAELTSGEAPQVRRARLEHAAIVLRRLVPGMEARLQAEHERIRKVLDSAKQREEAAARAENAYAARIDALCGEFLQDWTARARGSAQVLASTTSVGKPDSRAYTAQMNAALGNAWEEAFAALLSRLGEVAELRSTHVATLHRMLGIPRVRVEPPAPAAQTGGMGGLFQKVAETPFGATVGGWLGQKGPEAAADLARDVREAIHRAAEETISTLERARPGVVDYLVQSTFRPEEAPSSPAPDDSAVRRWEALLRTTTQLADQAAALAEQDQSR